MDFIEKLRTLQQERDSWLCLGLDPSPDLMPDGVDVWTFNRRIVDATTDLVCGYKLNLAYYLAYGAEGWEALEKTVAHIPAALLTVLDAKFGDTGYTAKHYAKAAYEVLKVDAVTVSPYVGLEAIVPLLDFPGKMVYVLIRSTNVMGNDFQEWPRKDSPLYRYVTGEINTLGRRYPHQIGFGVAATQPEDMARIRSWAPTIPFLIPGLGVQGGDLAAAVEYGVTRDGIPPLLNVTRAIIYASRAANFDLEARRMAEDWLAQIRKKREEANARARSTGQIPTVS